MDKPYKLLILDYGGVYSFKYVMTNFNKIMMRAFGVTPDEEQKESISRYSRLLGEDKITVSEYISQVGNILNVPILPSESTFIDATIEVTNPPSPEMTKLVSAVRQAGIKVSLLSDMYMFEVIRTRPWGRYEGFDYVAFSAEARMTKADPQFFSATLQHFSVEPEQALFVDDILKNVNVAASTGINTLHADKELYLEVSQLVDKIYNLLGLEQFDTV